jgi:hypothetical protein
MTELMKRFQEETGIDLLGAWTYEIVNGLMKPPFNESPWMKFNEWLAEQLTWRPVSEKPKEGQIVFGMISTGWVVAQYINGEFYVDDGFTFGDRIGDVIEWLPIPPSY